MFSQTRIIMGMPIVIGIADPDADPAWLESGFGLFRAVDARFSTYKPDSEISRINAGAIGPRDVSAPMREVLDLAERTRIETDGYFDIRKPDGGLDPSGIVKGWAIHKVALHLKELGARNFFVDAGGDIEVSGRPEAGRNWLTGIRNPFDDADIVKTIRLDGAGIATSGNYVRGRHIYNPHDPGGNNDSVVSLTVIGPDVLEADRFATAAYAMGEEGIFFIEDMPGLEGFLITADGMSTQTSGFGAFAP